VRHGARIINLSVAGRTSSPIELSAIKYAARRGVLLVAAAGNDALVGNPPEYPAAFLQPVGSTGVGGLGLTVGASDFAGKRALFSEFGSFVSLAAPGVSVFGALAPRSSSIAFPRSVLPGAAGLYGFASGTSFAAPQVAGAAALVWAAAPHLSAREVAEILKNTASGSGRWEPDLGFGVLDVAAAVDAASRARLVHS
jgi:subtilisin family serine protease